VRRRSRNIFFGGHVLALVVFSSVNGQTPSANPDSIIGLWTSQWIVPSPASGELTIEAKTATWRATIAGLTAPIQHDTERITFTLPKDAGKFRGRFVNSKKIVGHWIQPANQINNNCYATPAELLQYGDYLWRGKVEPLEARLSLYLLIHQADGGSLAAIIRNPEFNLFRRTVYDVEKCRNAVKFSDEKDPSNDFEAKLDEDDAQLMAHLPNIDGELIFKRR
jgi:hypothetical protein